MRTFILLAAVLMFSQSAIADNGLITVKSPYPVNRTADRLVDILTTKGMTVFARIDHAEGASKVGQVLRPTELVIFGNPRVGTPLMQCEQRVAIDLPQKALIWEDDNKQVWLSYNDPRYLATRHDIQGCDAVLDKVSTALGNFARAATAE